MPEVIEMPSDGPKRPSAFPSARTVTTVVVGMFLCGLAVAPWAWHVGDMAGSWLPWARATGGLRPWAAYGRPDCNYPPFMIYLWTAVEAVLRLLHASPWGRAAVTLVKLPNLVACAGGAALCAVGLRPVAGPAVARRVAVVYALCLPVWFNAAVWGQCDAMECVALLAAVVALIGGRPAVGGACVGWALSIKPQAVVILPVAVVYGFRRFGAVAVLRAATIAAAVVVLLVLPIAAGGRLREARLAYTGSVGFFSRLSIDAFNPWALVTLFDTYVRHRSGPQLDTARWWGPITPRHVGLLAFGGFTTFLSVGLYRRPTRYNAALMAGLTAYGFYMLATEMHERYVIPAAALLALCAASGGGRTYLAVMVPALINQVKSLVSENCDAAGTVTPHLQHVFDAVKLVVSVANCLLFFWVSRSYYRKVVVQSAPTAERFVDGSVGAVPTVTQADDAVT